MREVLIRSAIINLRNRISEQFLAICPITLHYVHQTVKIGLAISLFGITLAAVFAAISPAEGYELSIYTATPTFFWIGVGTTILLGIIGGVFLENRSQLCFTGLAVVAIILVISLPIIRDYAYFGQADALQHLGWVIDIRKGVSAIQSDPYPALHILAALLSVLLGASKQSALMMIIPTAYISFAFSLSLLVREFSISHLSKNSNTAISFGLLFSLLTPPILVVNLPALRPIPTVFGLLLLPLTAWIFIRTIQSDMRYDPMFIILVLVLSMLTTIHPQQALAGLILIVGTTALLVMCGIFDIGHSYRYNINASIAATLIAGIVLGMWLATRLVFAGALVSLVEGIQGSATASTTISPPSSLSQIGSIPALFGKILTVPLVTGLLTIQMGVVMLRRIILKQEQGLDVVAICYLITFIPILGMGILQTVAGDISQALRYIGIVVGLGSPIAALSLLDISLRGRKTQTLVTILFIILATIAVPAMFRSPWEYQAGEQVTESQISGYDWVLHYQPHRIGSGDVSVKRITRSRVGLDGETSLRQINGSGRGESLVPAGFNDQKLPKWRNGTWSLILTSYSREQQIHLYDGLSFTKEDYEYLNQSSKIERVYDNGGFSNWIVYNR